MESKERKALERIESLVRTQVVRSDGEDNTAPSFLDIYNLAYQGLREDGAGVTSYCEASSDIRQKSSVSS